MFKNLLIILCLMANVALAQQPKGKITGKITDATNNQPLSFASVSIFKNQKYHAEDKKKKSIEGMHAIL